MSSDYNAFHDRLLEADLGLQELWLGIAIMRATLGWNARENRIGNQLLREKTGLDGRSFERARAALIEKELIRYTPGARGRGQPLPLRTSHRRRNDRSRTVF